MKAEDPDHHPTPVVSCENCVRSIPASSLETKDREVGALLSELRCFCMCTRCVLVASQAPSSDTNCCANKTPNH